MKKELLIFIFLFFSFISFGQREDEVELFPLNWFLRVSPSLFTINSTPSTLGLDFWDDDFIQTDSISANLETHNMWSYGFSCEASYLMKKDFTISQNAFFGIGSNNMFTYINQLSLGKELSFEKFYVQPRLGISYIYTSLRIGKFYSENKDYFEVNNRLIYDDMKVSLKSRAFAINPSVLVEYPIGKYVAVFGQIGGFYTFSRASFHTFSGVTDEYDSDGNAITAFESRNFDHYNIDFFVNNRKLLSRQSPYLHYNFNSLFLQFGFCLQLVTF